MNINDHHDEIARTLYDVAGFHAADTWETDTSINRGRYEGLAEGLLASPALARLLAAARDEARAESETPADVLDGTGVTANTWQSAARRLADENRALLSAFDELRRTLNEIRGGTR